ncbi:MAG: hypothetical protein GC164_12955 [Phycisphaera sp.]|nr:hypothetical protein [Phycisphaera sp.]
MKDRETGKPVCHWRLARQCSRLTFMHWRASRQWHPNRFLLLILMTVMMLCPNILLADDAPAEKVPWVIQPNDRVLFVGDDMTQQMFYTRAVATGYLAMRPDDNLRFYNGGKDGSTVGDALKWIDDLLALTKPTVVTVCFGLNDVTADPDADKVVTRYTQDLQSLIQRIKASPGVRRVAVISPPPIQTGIGPEGRLLGVNLTMQRLAQACRDVAVGEGQVFIDLFEHMCKVYDAANTSGGEPLTYAGKLPTEAGAVVVASMVMWGLGVESAQIEPVGWSPVKPESMHKVRQVLAWRIEPVSLEQSQKSRAVYGSFRRFDELVFRAWRLAPRKPSGPTRAELMGDAEMVWTEITRLNLELYGRTGVVEASDR